MLNSPCPLQDEEALEEHPEEEEEEDVTPGRTSTISQQEVRSESSADQSEPLGCSQSEPGPRPSNENK